MSYATLRDRLFREDPHCHWCRALTVLSAYGKPKTSLATIDHIKCREEAQSHAEYIHPSNKVLACYDCNQKRNHSFRVAHTQAANPPRVLRR